MNKSRLIYSHRADSHVHVCTCTYNILNMNIYTCIRTCNILKMPLLIYKREEGFIFISETLRISMFACQCYYVIIMISYLSNLPTKRFILFLNIFQLLFHSLLVRLCKKGRTIFSFCQYNHHHGQVSLWQ